MRREKYLKRILLNHECTAASMRGMGCRERRSQAARNRIQYVGSRT